MKILKVTLLLMTLCLMLYSCSKEKHPRVKYEVSSTSSTFIAYSMVSATVSTETISGSWSKSFRHSQGGTVYLRATHSGIGTTKISIYVNKELVWTESSSTPGETIQILEVLP